MTEIHQLGQMTIDEFDTVAPYLSMLLRQFTGHYKGVTKMDNWLNANRRLDVTGVYHDDGVWIAMVDHIVGDKIECEIAYWIGNKWSWHPTFEEDYFANIGE